MRSLRAHPPAMQSLPARYGMAPCAVQLAVVLDLSRRGMTEYFVCADTRLYETAEDAGLVIVNPVQL
jgi:hypothetical protein